jgi:hypothetical protein
MMLEVAEHVTGLVVSGAAHWIPEDHLTVSPATRALATWS